MFKSALKKTLALALSAAGMASAVPYTFIYNGASYGIMDLTVSNESTVQVQFTAAGSVPGLTTFQVTGFAFDVASGLSLSITNPSAAQFANDQDDLTWINLTSMSSIPNATNSGVSKSIWDIGVTEGNNNGYNPPGILPGETDFFYLTGFSGLTDDASIASAINLQGIRIQAMEPGDGSLFLTSTPITTAPAVPEPGAMALMGLGLAGLAFASRRRKK